MANEKPNPNLIKKYPFLGFSTNLIEYFAVVGYEESILKEFIIPQYPKHLPITPTVLSSITSKNDYGIVDNDLIIKQIYPDNPPLIPIANPLPSPSNLIYSFCFDTYNGQSKQFYVCYAYRFYETFKGYQFHTPKAFCIISQYPFFTTFKKISENLYKIAMNADLANFTETPPIEFIIYNIVNYVPSPINFNINLDIFDHDNNYEVLASSLELKQLSGYPYVDFDLAELFNYLPLNLVIQIFIFTVLEQSMLFFSPNLEILNLIMYIMSILSYPCNDSTYFWHIVSVSKKVLEENNGENKFVGKIMTSLLGIPCAYNDSINTFGFSQAHYIVDLENKKMFLRVSGDMDDEDKKELKKICNLQDYIDMILRDKKVQSFFLKKFVSILYKDLEALLREGNPNFTTNPKNYKNPKFFEWNKDIYKRNRKIQEIFYSFYLNILMIFYQDNTLSSSFDKIKKEDDEEREKKLYFLHYQESEKAAKFSKEERTFCEEFRNSVKYRIYLDNFVQDFKCMDVYKIPLIFSEEFIIIKKKDKNDTLKKYISCFDIIDKYYFNSPSEGTQIINITMNNFYSNYPEAINQILLNQKNIKRSPLFSLNKKMIKQYIHYLSNISLEELNSTFPSISIQESDNILYKEKNKILYEIEVELIEKGLVTNRNLIFYTLIYVFSTAYSCLSFRTAMNTVHSLNQKLEKITFFMRKYIYILLLTFYKHLDHEKNPIEGCMTRQQIKMFYFVFVNYIRNNYILPDEDMMNLLRQFNKQESCQLLSKTEGLSDKEEVEYYSKEDDSFQIFPSYNFARDGIKKSNDLVNLGIKELEDKDLVIKSGKIEIKPKINYLMKEKLNTVSIYSPKKMYRIAKELFDTFINSEELNIKNAINVEDFKGLITNLIFYEKNASKSEIDYSFLIDILFKLSEEEQH